MKPDTTGEPPLVRLTPLDVALGMLYDRDPATSALRADAAVSSPRAALEAVVRESLLQGPCAVSFSGGRDSSTVLAIATRVAREEGLRLPVPVTLRFADRASDEKDWQELVVRHLGLQDWVRLDVTDEVDLVGPWATALMRSHGVVWPPNAHFHMPIAAQVSGGSLLTGFGGDEVLGGWVHHRAHAVLRRQIPPRPRDPLRVVQALRPAWSRYPAVMRAQRRTTPRRWLTATGREALRRLWVDAVLNAQPRWDRYVTDTWWTSRYVRSALGALRAAGDAAGVRVVSPFADRRFLEAAARTVGPAGFASRTAALRMLAGDVLPPDVVERTGKAEFTGGFWNVHAREFARRWSGEGLECEYVDSDALREEWRQDHPDARSDTLLQSMYAASVGFSGNVVGGSV